GRAQSGLNRGLATRRPQLIRSDVRHDDLTAESRGRGARADGGVGAHVVQEGRNGHGQIEPRELDELRTRLIEQRYEARNVRIDLRDQLDDGRQGDLELELPRQALEHELLAGREQLVVLALADVGDAAAQEAAVR